MLRKTKRHWRFYKTERGSSPPRDFIKALDDEDVTSIVAEMNEVRRQGLSRARHLRGDIYEARVDGKNRSFRILFSTEGRFSQVLLAVHAIEKRTQRTPPKEIELAENRLREWRDRRHLQ